MAISQPDRNELGWMYWVLLPGLIMSLGWGLRGYIGGGPHGAMIPGALVVLMITVLLGYRKEAAALAAAFGAIGIGFGGNMTYGQTIGLAREADTVVWGMIGLTLKGAIWGILGGAVVGLGLVAGRVERRLLAGALACLLAGCFLGQLLINDPKLIYFSNLHDRPRDESWAGLLFAAIALLAFLRWKLPEVGAIAGKFALYGGIAGGIGFGGGALWFILESFTNVPKWLPWWKYMEFSFGLCFGLGLGLCAWHMRDRLIAASAVPEPPSSERAYAADYLISLGLLILSLTLPMLAFILFSRVLGLGEVPLARTLLGVLFGFTGIGSLLLYLSHYSQLAAWTTAGAITFVATLMDLVEDWGPEGQLQVPEAVGWALLLIAALGSIALVVYWTKDSVPRTHILLVLMWALMGVGYAKGLSDHQIWMPDPTAIEAAGGRGAFLFGALRSELIVHAIFTTLVIASTLLILRLAKAEAMDPKRP